jgi:hypothetical protein
VIVLAGAALALGAARGAEAQAGANVRPPAERGTPRSGREVLQRMHDRYAGRWFQTLTFVQTTELRRADGRDTTETWYESVRAPDRLRIDRGTPTEGNGMLFTPDSVYVAKAGSIVHRAANGNELIPFVVGVYTQPVDSTLADLRQVPIDMSKVRGDRWRGRPVYVVGAASAVDSTAAQFWVDVERLVLVRIKLPAAPGAPGPVQDIHFDRYVPLGASWLATEVTMTIGPVRVLHEEYSAYTADPPLPADLFEPSRWSAAPHWAVTRAPATRAPAARAPGTAPPRR